MVESLFILIGYCFGYSIENENLYMIKRRGINRNILPLGIHLKYFSLIYEENLLIQEIITFKIVKQKLKFE